MKCTRCNGTGKVTEMGMNAAYVAILGFPMPEIHDVDCPDCGGKGEKNDK